MRKIRRKEKLFDNLIGYIQYREHGEKKNIYILFYVWTKMAKEKKIWKKKKQIFYVYIKKGWVMANTTPINFRNNPFTELNMVTSRITDLRNAGLSSSGAQRSQVPLKR